MRRCHTAYNEASNKGLRTTSTDVGNVHTAPLNRVDSDTIDTLAKLRMGLASVQIQFFVSRRFPLPLPLFPLLLGAWLFRPLPLFVSLNEQSLPHVANTSTREATCLLHIDSLSRFPFAFCGLCPSSSGHRFTCRLGLSAC